MVRIAWVAFVPVIPESDCILYDGFARNMAAGNGFSWEAGRPTVFVPVGAPFLYSLCYRIFGLHYLPIAIINTLIGVCCVAFTMGLARRFFGASAGFFAGLLLSLCPSQIEFVTTLATEPPFLFFMLAGWFAFPDEECPWLLRSILAGVLFAAASYIRPVSIPLPVILSITPVVGRRVLLRPVLQASVALLVMGMCLVPWAMRNQQVFGEFTLSAHGGLNMWMGNNPESAGGFTLPPESTARMTELERAQYLGALARSYIRRYPARFLGRTLVKFVRLHERESIGIHWNITALHMVLSPAGILALKVFNNIYWWVALGLGLSGVVSMVRNRSVLATLIQPAVLVWGYFAAVHAIVVIQDRYHFPIMPSVAMLGAFFLVRTLQGGRARETVQLTTSQNGARRG